jgi:hypothetical protein
MFFLGEILPFAQEKSFSRNYRSYYEPRDTPIP